ncbi:MAG: hypothetical protein KAI61_06715, partial [Alphaproteobacteria bacterium]|nr:hypothetical protein [Alphaproteobacteria bacterium]
GKIKLNLGFFRLGRLFSGNLLKKTHKNPLSYMLGSELINIVNSTQRKNIDPAIKKPKMRS